MLPGLLRLMHLRFVRYFSQYPVRLDLLGNVEPFGPQLTLGQQKVRCGNVIVLVSIEGAKMGKKVKVKVTA